MTKKVIKSHSAPLTPTSDIAPVEVPVDDSARLREIRQLVRVNNRSKLDDNLIVCQIYMESRFDPNATAQGSSARGLMQLLKAPVRELYRVRNLKKPHGERQSESAVFAEADRFHDSPGFADEATNIRTGTEYLQYLIDRERARGALDPIVEAYKDYRGLRNGIYYRKIRSAADKLNINPDSMQILLDMVK